MKTFPKSLFLILLSCAVPRAASACDACALFVAPPGDKPGWTLALSEQFTHFGTVWSGANRLPNPVDQYLESSTTQLSANYTHGTWWRLQATVPYIRRSYLRPDHALIERGTVEGVGDATLSGNFRVWQKNLGEHRVALGLLAGIELPTGNADHLGDEIGHHFHHHAGFPDSGIHGHDLALGSGSTDYLLGVDSDWENGSWFARASLQYKLRRPGKFGYRLDDEVAWEAGPGYRFARTEAYSFSAQALVSGEHKGFDTLGGVAQVDTGFNVRYAGFRLAGERGRHFTTEGAIELPIRLRTSETMVVPDYRVRAAVTWRL